MGFSFSSFLERAKKEPALRCGRAGVKAGWFRLASGLAAF
jgi:hypothetical protein